MKNKLFAILVTAVAALTLTTAAYAQLRSITNDSTAASPKVRQMLNEQKAPAPAATPAMVCGKCADVRTAKLSPQTKGAEILTGAKQVTFLHSCTGCEIRLAVAGEGKAKHQVVIHKCSLDIPNAGACCAGK